MNISPQDILDYWYSPRVLPQWFNATPELDNEIFQKYTSLWQQALSGELNNWRETPHGCLALVIILDQFPLNMFRSQAKAFQSERQAVEVAWHAVKNHFDQHIARDQLAFLYMPFMHSEFLAEQELSVNLYQEAGLEMNAKFARHHRDIIKKFGRFPHRNAILGRESTEAELLYLASPQAFNG